MSALPLSLGSAPDSGNKDNNNIRHQFYSVFALHRLLYQGEFWFFCAYSARFHCINKPKINMQLHRKTEFGGGTIKATHTRTGIFVSAGWQNIHIFKHQILGQKLKI